MGVCDSNLVRGWLAHNLIPVALADATDVRLQVEMPPAGTRRSGAVARYGAPGKEDVSDQ